MRVVRQSAWIVLLTCLAGCSGWQSALDPGGVQASQLKSLIWFIASICTVVWLLVVCALAWALLRKRPRVIELSVEAQRPLTIAVAVATTATVLIVAMFTIASFLATRSLVTAGDDALKLRVRSHQWWWEVTYYDENGAEEFVTANEIHIPVGRAVSVQLESADVIHSFWIPSLAGKQDLIPGRQNAISFRADRAGVYRGQCAEFCGVQHAHMAMLVVAEEPEAFRTWLDGQRRPAELPSGEDAKAGAAAFLKKPCSACHTIRGTTASARLGPDLTHVGSRRQIAASTLDNTNGAMAAWLADPQTLKPGSNMPMVPLDAAELKSISAYMMSLK